MTASKAKKWQSAFSAWACVGVMPDGREVILDVGKREDVTRSYGLLFNCPVYDSVHVRDLNEKPIRGEVNTRA